MGEARATCGGCTASWTGFSRAHCSACHRTFSSPSTFDQHRRLKGEVGFCVDPATLAGQMYADGIWRSAQEFTGAKAVYSHAAIR